MARLALCNFAAIPFPPSGSDPAKGDTGSTFRSTPSGSDPAKRDTASSIRSNTHRFVPASASNSAERRHPHALGRTYIVWMARPLRFQYPGALYHVTARGNRRAAIFRDDVDRRAWLKLLGDACERFHFCIHAFCQMTNHYHLLVETMEGNPADGMRHLNGVYSQYVNKRHQLVGHLFQGRYHAVLVQKDGHLLELARYLVANPVRAGVVDHPESWPWSSYQWMIGDARCPVWFNANWLLGNFSENRVAAVSAYIQFVSAGLGMPSPLAQMGHRFVLGDESFIETHSSPAAAPSPETTCSQRFLPAMTLPQYLAAYPDRDKAMAHAYFSTIYTMREIGAYFGVSERTVARAVVRAQRPI